MFKINCEKGCQTPEKEIKENPPINEKMIRAMFLQMGRKPSEAQIRQIMKSVNANRK